jgi:hypothetical protein
MGGPCPNLRGGGAVCMAWMMSSVGVSMQLASVDLQRASYSERFRAKGE